MTSQGQAMTTYSKVMMVAGAVVLLQVGDEEDLAAGGLVLCQGSSGSSGNADQPGSHSLPHTFPIMPQQATAVRLFEG